MGVDVEPYAWLISITSECEGAKTLVEGVEAGEISPDDAVTIFMSTLYLEHKKRQAAAARVSLVLGGKTAEFISCRVAI